MTLRTIFLGTLLLLFAATSLGTSVGLEEAVGTVPTWTPVPETGYRLFRLWCVSCHGDALRGLTPEWIAKWPAEDQNCWTPKCHGLNHPPDGFTIPRDAPAIAGPGALLKFRTAADLFAYVSAAMPYQDPGVLSDEQYFKILGYVLERHGADVPAQGLSSANAAAVVIHVLDPGGESPSQPTSTAEADILPTHVGAAVVEPTSTDQGMDPRVAGFAVALGVIVGVALFLRRRRSPPPSAG